MCKYVKENLCTINNTPCPFMYFCEKNQIWKANKAMPDRCKVSIVQEIPKGYYRVIDVRKNYLYIDMEDYTIKVENPFDVTPLYVKVSKTKNGYKIRK